jgi:hypothetical protein
MMLRALVHVLLVHPAAANRQAGGMQIVGTRVTALSFVAQDLRSTVGGRLDATKRGAEQLACAQPCGVPEVQHALPRATFRY